MSSLIDQLQELDRCVAQCVPAGLGESWFAVTAPAQKPLPVLVSAPHGSLHQRSGMQKMGEEYTSAIAQYLAAQTGCSAIYAMRQSPEDANWAQQSDYKNKIAEIVGRRDIGFVIDLHGMIDRHGMGIALGTMQGRSCVGYDVETPFLSSGFTSASTADLDVHSNSNWRRLVVDHPRFTGGLRNYTITRFVAEDLQLAAVQVELAAIARVIYSAPDEHWPFEYRGNETAITTAVNALHALVQSVAAQVVQVNLAESRRHNNLNQAHLAGHSPHRDAQ